MNPLTNMRNVVKLSEQELYTNNRTSWHDQYKDSAWIFIGGLPYDLSEGDIISIFSQYGEIVNINLIRDKDSGKSKGFCFLCYEDQKSTVLAVDNFNGIKVLNRILRVDHVSKYKVPKQGENTDPVTKKLYEEGCGPKTDVSICNKVIKIDSDNVRDTLADQIISDIKLPARLPICPVKIEPKENNMEANPKKLEEYKEKKSKKKKSKKKHSSDELSTDSDNEHKKNEKKSKSFWAEESNYDSRKNYSKKLKKY